MPTWHHYVVLRSKSRRCDQDVGIGISGKRFVKRELGVHNDSTLPNIGKDNGEAEASLLITNMRSMMKITRSKTQ